MKRMTQLELAMLEEQRRAAERERRRREAEVRRRLLEQDREIREQRMRAAAALAEQAAKGGA